MRIVPALLALILASACHHAPSGGAVQYVLRVDQRLDRTAIAVPSDPPPESSFRAVEPFDAYAITVDGDAVTITALDGSKKTIGGHRARPDTGSEPGEERFALESGVFAGGRLVLRGARAELTIYGSGVPIVSSDRGTLVQR
jgi:hypothetical protein